MTDVSRHRLFGLLPVAGITFAAGRDASVNGIEPFNVVALVVAALAAAFVLWPRRRDVRTRSLRKDDSDLSR